jgi:hypothetical protein
MITSITSFLSQEDQNVFKNISSKAMNHRFIIETLETSKDALTRAQSFQILRSPEIREQIVEKYGNVSIYPITLTFHPDDLPAVKALEVSSFIRRVQRVVFEGGKIEERFVI